MPRKTPLRERRARFVHAFLARLDPRLLVALVSVAGLAAWLLPWQVAAALLPLAALAAETAFILLPDGRGALTAYGIFVCLWSVSQFMLYLFENPAHFNEALAVSVYLGARLFILLGLALAVPLAATPLALGRTLAWYLGWLVRAEAAICGALFRIQRRPAADAVWRAALALCLMMAFFPRSLRVMRGLRRSLVMRAPRLSLARRTALMGLALLRALSAQTWDMTLAIASRDLYRPGPWAWRKSG